MRLLGLDLGERRIGIAMSDPLGITAQGYPYRKRSSLQADLGFFTEWISKYEVSGVVVGLPLNMNGTEGPAAEHARHFGEMLRQTAAIEVFYWDERLTTTAALQVLIQADLSRSKRREKVDQIAAVIILQNFLDSQNKELIIEKRGK